MEKTMEITINGVKENVPENSSITDLMGRFQDKKAHIILQHNGEFVYPEKHATTVVKEGDKIEFINPDLGG